MASVKWRALRIILPLRVQIRILAPERSHNPIRGVLFASQDDLMVRESTHVQIDSILMAHNANLEREED
jgi:hypothetical protein